jgi:hypothetical protein
MHNAVIPYLVRLLEIMMNNNAIPDYWKIAIVLPSYTRGDRLVVGNY